MALTGHPRQAPRVPPGPVWSRIEALIAQLAELSAEVGSRVDADAAALLSGRAALLGLPPLGRTAAQRSCRLLDAGDGWLAVNLARPSDVDAVAAIAGRAAVEDPWRQLEEAAGDLGRDELVTRAQRLGVPASRLPSRPVDAAPWGFVDAGPRKEPGGD